LIKIALDPSGKYAAVCSMDKCIRLLDLENKTCISRGFGHSELITGVHFTMDGKRLISTSTDGCIFVWKLDPNIVKDIKARLSKKVGIIWPSSLVSEDYVKTPVKIKFDVNYDELPRWAKEQIDMEELNEDSTENNNNNNTENSNINNDNSNISKSMENSKSNNIDKNTNNNFIIKNITNNSSPTMNDTNSTKNLTVNSKHSQNINNNQVQNQKLIDNLNKKITSLRLSDNVEQPLIKGVWEKVNLLLS